MTVRPHINTISLCARYGSEPVLEHVSFEAGGGSLIGLIGPNGAGKTTLIKALANLLAPASGSILVDGKAHAAWNRDALARRVGYLSQSRTVHWPVTVERLVSLGRLPHRGPWDGLSETDQAAIQQAMELTDVQTLGARTVTTLSGGELARVLLARVLSGDPQIILADEPASGLDPGHRLQVMESLRDMAHGGRLVIAVLHDLTLASRFCDRLILLQEGRVAADGAPQAVLTPERLEQVYGVSAVTVEQDAVAAVLPWTHL